MDRTIIIGDIHGCSGSLRQLLAKLEPDAAADRLILLGDLFDRGPDSWEVFQTVKALEEEFGERFTLLRGNHEDYLLQPRLTLAMRMVWERVGRRAAVRSFRAHGERMEDCAPWLARHCLPYVTEERFQCTHAGVMIEPVEANDMHTLIHDHDIVLRNQYAGKLTIVGHIALAAAAWFAGDGETVTVLEEDVRRELPGTGIICIDTGCGKGGRLTAMVVEGSGFTLHSVPEQ